MKALRKPYSKLSGIGKISIARNLPKLQRMMDSMKVMFYGKPDTVLQNREYQRLITETKNQLGDDVVEIRDAVSRDSVNQMEIYQIVKTPAVLIAREDGSPVAMWQHTLPTISDIGYYYQSDR